MTSRRPRGTHLLKDLCGPVPGVIGLPGNTKCSVLFAQRGLKARHLLKSFYHFERKRAAA